MYLQRKLQGKWVARRLQNEVSGLMRHSEALRDAAISPPDELVVSLQNARVAIDGLQTELAAWGLFEIRPDQSRAPIEAFLEFDFAKELAHHGISLDESMEERIQRLREQLLRERRRRSGQASQDSPDGTLKELLTIANTVIDEALENQNIHDSRWRDWARRVLALVTELLITLLVGLVAVGFTVLVVDESLAKEMTKKVIEVLTVAMGLQAIHSAREKSRPRNLSTLLSMADKGIRQQARGLMAILESLSFRQPLTSREVNRASRFAACMSGHTYTVNRILEITEAPNWPDRGDYASLCQDLCELSDQLVIELTDNSRLSRWRLRRTATKKLEEYLCQLDKFGLPDSLPLKLP
ncbi:hypothetical protein [Spirillospora sp. CA-294931]|uniref:hypothetical protein n=1 Tax=Spirillospora sp. CA-294931 TaxID=3240042 RepID=UPI003D8D4EF5